MVRIFWKFLVLEEYNIKILATKFSPLLLLHCYSQVAKIVTLIFRLFCLLQKCLPSIATKSICENCGVQITKPNLARHKKNCSAGTLYCSKCPNFFTKSRDDLNYHIAKQHSEAGPSKTYKCNFCYAEFPGFYALRQHKNTQHGTQIGFGASNIGVEDVVGDVDDQSLREELQSCKHFVVDSEIQKERHTVFNFAVNNLTAQVIEEKMDHVLDKLKCVVKLNLALGFILKNIKDGKFRYFYAHENNTLLEQSKLVSNKDDMAKLKEILKKTDVIESCTKERTNTKWRFFKLTNLTIIAALLRDIPMGCKDAVLPESLLKNHTVNCLTYEQNTKKPYKTTFASSEHLLSTCMEMRDSKKKHQNYSTSFLLTVQILTLQSFKEFAWMIFHLWKI